MFWKIEESTGRYYFTHDPLYATREDAEKALATIASDRCRVAAYEKRQGPGFGPVRVGEERWR